MTEVLSLLLMRRFFFRYVSMILAAGLLSSCGKPDTYPLAPVLSFKNFSAYQNAQGVFYKGLLELEFTDGDGAWPNASGSADMAIADGADPLLPAVAHPPSPACATSSAVRG